VRLSSRFFFVYLFYFPRCIYSMNPGYQQQPMLPNHFHQADMSMVICSPSPTLPSVFPPTTLRRNMSFSSPRNFPACHGKKLSFPFDLCPRKCRGRFQSSELAFNHPFQFLRWLSENVLAFVKMLAPFFFSALLISFLPSIIRSVSEASCQPNNQGQQNK